MQAATMIVLHCQLASKNNKCYFNKGKGKKMKLLNFLIVLITTIKKLWVSYWDGVNKKQDDRRKDNIRKNEGVFLADDLTDYFLAVDQLNNNMMKVYELANSGLINEQDNGNLRATLISIRNLTKVK